MGKKIYLNEEQFKTYMSKLNENIDDNVDYSTKFQLFSEKMMRYAQQLKMVGNALDSIPNSITSISEQNGFTVTNIQKKNNSYFVRYNISENDYHKIHEFYEFKDELRYQLEVAYSKILDEVTCFILDDGYGLEIELEICREYSPEFLEDILPDI